MAEHRGEIVRRILTENRINKRGLADKMHKTTATLYNYLNDPDLSWEIIEKIGRLIKHDFTGNFKEMPQVPALNEDDVPYGLQKTVTASECLNKFEALRVKYIKLLEDYSTLQESYSKELLKYKT